MRSTCIIFFQSFTPLFTPCAAPPQSQRTPLSHHTDAGRCVGVVNEIARLHDVVKQAGIGGDILRADKPQSVKADAPSPKRTKETGII